MLKPRPRRNFEVTSSKIITTLVIFLGLVAIYKTYMHGKVDNQLFHLQTLKLMEEFQTPEDLEDKEKLSRAFDGDGYCGWRIKKGEDLFEASKKFNGYDVTRLPTESKTIKRDGAEAELTVCALKTEENDNSVSKHFIAILFIVAVILILLKRDDEPKQKKDNEQKETIDS